MGFSDPFQIYMITIFIVIVVLCIYWLIIRPVTERRPFSQTYKGLYGNTHRLGLQVCEVNEKCMFAAVADQLSVKCPQGNYSAEQLKKRVATTTHKESPQWGLSQLRQRFRYAMVMNDWQTDVDKLQALVDAIHRVIEVVHDEHRETTVIRPFDMKINESIMVLYIGRCRRGYYSLRPNSKEIIRKKSDNDMISEHVSIENYEDVQLCSMSETRVKGNTKAAKEDIRADVLSQNNFMIGDNCRQFIINRPGYNTEGTDLQINTIYGKGSTQNILVTCRTSSELGEFLRKRKIPEGVGLTMKIRQCSDNLPIEQIENDELALIPLLNSGDSEVRHELDKVLDDFELSFDKAKQGCILLQFSAHSSSSFLPFAAKFNHQELDSFIKFVLKYLLIDKNAESVAIDLELSVDTESKYDVQESGNVPGSKRANEADMNCIEQPGYSRGITILCKPKPTPREQDNSTMLEPDDSIHTFQQEVVQTVFNSAFEAGLLKPTCEMNAHYEQYSFDPSIENTDDPRLEINKNKMNKLFESMNGLLGIVTTRDGKRGTCFQVGNNHVLTAAHVICDAADLKCDLHVKFPSEDWQPAILVYRCDDLDFAIMCVYGKVGKENKIKWHLRPGIPGLPLNLMNPGNDTHWRPTIDRTFIVRNDYLFCNRGNVNFLILEALGDLLRPGSSGSPGFMYLDNNVYIITVVIGLLTTSEGKFYVGTSMIDIIKHLESFKPDLWRELVMISHNYDFARGSSRAVYWTPSRHQMTLPSISCDYLEHKLRTTKREIFSSIVKQYMRKYPEYYLRFDYRYFYR